MTTPGNGATTALHPLAGTMPAKNINVMALPLEMINSGILLRFVRSYMMLSRSSVVPDMTSKCEVLDKSNSSNRKVIGLPSVDTNVCVNTSPCE